MANEIESLDHIIANKQIKTVFQPIISLEDASIYGYETLSRLTCESVFENMDSLFTAAKKHKRKYDLEKVCRDKTFEALASFDNDIFKKKLFINVSPNVINQAEFNRNMTEKALKEYGLYPENIVFEITERTKIENINCYKSKIADYKNQGFKIALDDLGTAYSGIMRIKDVEPHYLKIDMDLVRNINKDDLKKAILKGMVTFSKNSNTRLIAEGIETFEELEALIELGINYGQGYYIQRPDAEIKSLNPTLVANIKEINTKLRQKNHINLYYSPIKYLCKRTETIGLDTKILDAFALMKDKPDCMGLCVVDNQIPIGVVTKESLALRLGGQHGFSYYHNKPVSLIMDNTFLTVDKEMPINTVSKLATNQEKQSYCNFIVVTEDGKCFGTVTVKALLEKKSDIEIKRARHQNPLTGLPGNLPIEEKLNQYVNGDGQFSASYIDIDNFKAYNDNYGYGKGDKIILLLADILRQEFSDLDFIGHIGGDDFVVIVDGIKRNHDLKLIVERFESEVLAFYNERDRESGYITARSRNGVKQRFPLMSITTATINNERREYRDALEISDILSSLKKSEKQQVDWYL